MKKATYMVTTSLEQKHLQSLEYPCDTRCHKAQKKVVGKVYAMGGGADWETVTTYDFEGNADDYYVVYVEHDEAVYIDVECSGCGTKYDGIQCPF